MDWNIHDNLGETLRFLSPVLDARAVYILPPNPNMVTMVKNGASKLALDRVPSMAKALECDPAYLMRLALEQAVGDPAAQAIIEIFGTPITANELGWLEAIREVSDNSDPRLTSRSRAAIMSIFGR